jgi:hypothetical protein
MCVALKQLTHDRIVARFPELLNEFGIGTIFYVKAICQYIPD